MKNHYIIIVLSILISFSLFAQPQPQQPVQLPKHEIGMPAANIKSYPHSSQYLYLGNWKGNVIWVTAEAGHSATIPEIKFTLNGEAIWQSPFQEIIAAQPGTFNISGNDISISFKYGPYKYFLKGVYNKNLGKITGTFTQDRMKYLNAPLNYIPGNISGTFSISK